MLTKTCPKCSEPVPKELFGEHLASACIALGGTPGVLNRRKTNLISKQAASNPVGKSAMLEYKPQKRVVYQAMSCHRCCDFTTYNQHQFDQHVRLCLTKNYVFCPCCNVRIEEGAIADHIKKRVTKFYTFLLRKQPRSFRRGYVRCFSCQCLVESIADHRHRCPFHLKRPYTTDSSRSIKCPECLQPVTWKEFFTHVGMEHPHSLLDISKTDLDQTATFPYLFFKEPMPRLKSKVYSKNKADELIKCPECSVGVKKLQKHLRKCHGIEIITRSSASQKSQPSPQDVALGNTKCKDCGCETNNLDKHMQNCVALENKNAKNKQKNLVYVTKLAYVSDLEEGVSSDDALSNEKSRCEYCGCQPNDLQKHLQKCAALKKVVAKDSRKSLPSTSQRSASASRFDGLTLPSYGTASDNAHLDGSRGYGQLRDSSGRFHSYSSFDDYSEDGMP